MNCEICGKNDATIHIQEIVNGKKKSIHICPSCAAEKAENDPILQGFNLAEMLYNLSEQIELPVVEPESLISAESEPPILITCSSCGWDSSKFRKTGRLGCANCYEVFKEIIAGALKNMHRGTLHVGKKVGPSSEKDDSRQKVIAVMNFQKELDELILREEYEKAAIVRDKINELKNNVKTMKKKK